MDKEATFLMENERVNPLVTFLELLMASDPNTAIDILTNHGQTVLSDFYGKNTED